jgi:hypothetical protein
MDFTGMSSSFPGDISWYFSSWYTEIYKQSAGLVSFSPGAHFILTAVQERLIVRRSDTFQITRTWLVDVAPTPTHNVLSNSSKSTAPNASATTTDNWISHIGWSCDSEYLFAACAKKGVVNVFKLRDEDWSSRIDAGAEGLVKAEWAPDGRTILCFSEWGVSWRHFTDLTHFNQPLQLRVTIWSLVTGSATYIQFPVHPDRGIVYASTSYNGHQCPNFQDMPSVPMEGTLFWQSAINQKIPWECTILPNPTS